MDFSKTVASLPDRECLGFKPHETEVCSERPSCGIEQALADASIAKDILMKGHTRHQLLPLTDRHMKVTNSATTSKPFSYSWKTSGFSSCTSSCLGGLQESIVTCVESGAGTALLVSIWIPSNIFYCSRYHFKTTVILGWYAGIIREHWNLPLEINIIWFTYLPNSSFYSTKTATWSKRIFFFSFHSIGPRLIQHSSCNVCVSVDLCVCPIAINHWLRPNCPSFRLLS